MFHKDLAQKPFPSKYSAQTNQSVVCYLNSANKKILRAYVEFKGKQVIKRLLIALLTCEAFQKFRDLGNGILSFKEKIQTTNFALNERLFIVEGTEVKEPRHRDSTFNLVEIAISFSLSLKATFVPLALKQRDVLTTTIAISRRSGQRLGRPSRHA